MVVNNRGNGNWFVFYTKSRAEKKVLSQLQSRNREVFLPLVREVRQWSDRKKAIEVPLFKSYIFVFCAEHEIPELLQWTPGLVASIRYNGKPAFIREQELQQIDRFVRTGLRVETGSEEELTEGDKVKVMGGPLEGMEGEIMEMHNQEYFVVRIEAIQQYMRIQVSRNFLMKVQ